LLIGFLHTNPDVASQGGKIRIVASMETFASIAKFIGGDMVSVDYILPEGADPHDYSLTFSDIEKIRNADILVLANSEFFALEQQILENALGKPYIDFKDYALYNAAILPIPGIEKNYHGYWIYPDNALAIAHAIADALISFDPANHEIYENNLQEFKERIQKLKHLISETAMKKSLRGFGAVVAVPGAAYIAYAFGMNVVASLLKGPGRFVNASELEKIREIAQSGFIRVILCPLSLANGKAGEISNELSRNINVPVVYVRVFSSGGLMDYFALMMYNIGALSGISNVARESLGQNLLMLLYTGIGILFVIAITELVIIYNYTRRAEEEWYE